MYDPLSDPPLHHRNGCRLLRDHAGSCVVPASDSSTPAGETTERFYAYRNCGDPLCCRTDCKQFDVTAEVAALRAELEHSEERRAAAYRDAKRAEDEAERGRGLHDAVSSNLQRLKVLAGAIPSGPMGNRASSIWRELDEAHRAYLGGDDA